MEGGFKTIKKNGGCGGLEEKGIGLRVLNFGRFFTNPRIHPGDAGTHPLKGF
jgi:hypothetical protein